MSRVALKASVVALGLLLVALPPGCSGSTGAAGAAGPPGTSRPSGPTPINASSESHTALAALDVVSEVTNVTIASPPVITFTMKTAAGVPIIGLVPFWADSSRFVRFTLTKLVPGTNGDPDRWVAYVRDDTTGAPDYDTGSSLVDNGDGSYVFTFSTDVTNVPGVPYESTLTHRVAGQIGSYRTVPLEEQNLWLDFVPDGRVVSRARSLSVMSSCNECHSHLVFHGRRFAVEYCVQCHNADLAEGEGDFAFMIHRIHNAGKFEILDGGISYAEVTYPQEVINCRKCHNVEDTATPQADGWRDRPNMSACGGCHDVFTKNTTQLHTGGQQTDNARCTTCHSRAEVMNYHTTPNSTPNNPELLAGQRKITYELVDTTVGGSNEVNVKFRILSDGKPLDLTNLPPEFKDSSGVVFRFPGLLLAWAQPQDGIAEPADYNNLGRKAGQPLSLDLGDFAPIQSTNPVGTLSFNAGDGVMTATVTSVASQFPMGAKMRAVGLQGYLRQDLNNDGDYDVSLHAISAVRPIAGDRVRREIVDTAKCAQCHEFFEGHGGNRVFSAGSANVCVLCHVPNLTSSGRELDLKHPEDTQNLRDMIHGIHASAFRSRDFTHVRNFRNAARVYNWSHVTFPRGASTSNCQLCHKPGTYDLPLASGLLPTTVRTTGVENGQDATTAAAISARTGLPNATDWVNTPTGSACFYCHTSMPAWAHMVTNGAQLTVPDIALAAYVNRANVSSAQSCAVCHGDGKQWDVKVVHNR